MCKYLHLTLLVLFISLVNSADKTENDTFIATKEWQSIKEGKYEIMMQKDVNNSTLPFLPFPAGQKVPSGLHYRINLETGEKEAKLLDDDSTEYLQEKGHKSAMMKITSPEDSGGGGSPNKSSSSSSTVPGGAAANIEEALKNIPAEIYEYSKEEMEEIKNQFRTYDQIKDQLKDANLNVRTDAEIMKKLFSEYDELVVDVVKKQAEVERILGDLEYLVHQVDNAIQFLDQGGLEKIVLPSLNRTNNSVLKVKSLQLLGSATQNNPGAQIIAYEKDVAEHLVRFLSTAKVESEINSALFAFSSLVRRFPVAQKHIMSRSVVNVLFEVWTKEINLKIKVRVLTLLTDLLMEAEEAKSEAELAGELATKEAEKRKQYESVNLEKLLQDFEYCKNVERFVVAEKPALISNPEQTERVISSLNYSTRLCKEIWSTDPDLRHVVLVLKNRFSDQILESSADDEEEDRVAYLRDLVGDIERLYSVLFQYLKEKVKEEL